MYVRMYLDICMYNYYICNFVSYMALVMTVLLYIRTYYQISMNVIRIMEGAVKFAATHLVATSVRVKKVTYWISMVLTAVVSGVRVGVVSFSYILLVTFRKSTL